jgi:cysteine desulfurase
MHSNEHTTPLDAPVYLDHNATTPVDPRVVEAMLPYFGACFGNPGSRVHRWGLDAEQGVSNARWQLARSLGARTKEIVFTSGATESNNIVLKSVAANNPGSHILVSAVEHPSVLATARAVAKQYGCRVGEIEVDADGRVDPMRVGALIEADTVLVSVMLANNETGVINPVGPIGEVCRERGVLFHSDAVQGYGKIALRLDQLHVDFVSLSAHKVYGPKGVGALVVRHRKPKIELTPLLHGGGQENGQRSGTLNVPGIVGFGAAAAIIDEELPVERERQLGLRDGMLERLGGELDGVALNGSREHRLPGTLNVSFLGIDSEALLQLLRDDVAVSAGSACATGNAGPSHVLQALGVSHERGRSAVRISMGRSTTAEQLDYATTRIINSVKEVQRRVA